MDLAGCVAFCRYLLQYQEPIPCEQLVTALCDIKQAYTQFGGTDHHHPALLLDTSHICGTVLTQEAFNALISMDEPVLCLHITDNIAKNCVFRHFD